MRLRRPVLTRPSTHASIACPRSQTIPFAPPVAAGSARCAMTCPRIQTGLVLYVFTLPHISDCASPRCRKFADAFGKRIKMWTMRHHFHTEQWLPYPRELVFAFFANPENLPRLMPKWQRARIEEATFSPPPPRPEDTPRFPGMAAGSGTRLTISARPFPLSPLRLPWDALIEDFRWNEGFCDVQLRGPFHYWRHCHSVRSEVSAESGLSGSVVADDVEYELPLGSAGDFANKLAVNRGMEMLFRYRQKQTQRLLALAAGQSTR